MIPLSPNDTIRNGDLKFLYVIISNPQQSAVSTCKVQQKLKFVITEIDVDTEEEIGSYEEDYDFPEVSIGVRDFI